MYPEPTFGIDLMDYLGESHSKMHTGMGELGMNARFPCSRNKFPHFLTDVGGHPLRVSLLRSSLYATPPPRRAGAAQDLS